MTHRWNWRKWLPERHGQLCRVLATGRMNSALVEFEDGTKVVTSRYAVRKLTHNDLGNRRAAFGASALTDELERLTHEDLRKWAEALDKEMPRGLGERLLRFAEAWREQVDCSNTNKA